MHLLRRLLCVAAALALLVACDGGHHAPTLTAISPTPTSPVVFTPTITTPVTPSPTPEPDAATFAQLAARPLHLPALASGAACPRTPSEKVGINLDPVLGNGPIYADVNNAAGLVTYDPSRVETDGSIAWKTVWVAAPNYHAPSLIRGQQIDGPHAMRFFNEEEGLRGPALRFPTETGVTSGGIPSDWRLQPSLTYFPGPGCYAYQVDGLNFSSVIVIEVQIEQIVPTHSP